LGGSWRSVAVWDAMAQILAGLEKNLNQRWARCDVSVG